MPRTDSAESSGASLTSEDEAVTRITSHPHPGPSTPRVTTRRAERPILGSTERFQSTQQMHQAPGPNRRFKATVSKVMALRKSTYAMSSSLGHGAEPGINPRAQGTASFYSYIHEACEVEIVDYSAAKVQVTQYDNKGLIQYLESKAGSRPPWAKVRWINVGGISWDVLSALAIKYELHPLALENVLEGRKTSRSKADYYENQLFIRILCHSLEEKVSSTLEEVLKAPEVPIAIPRVNSPSPMDEKNSISTGDLESQPNTVRNPKKKGVGTFTRMREEKRAAAESRINAADRAIDALKDSADRVHVNVRNLFLFLCRDGTVIAIHSSDRGFGDPILNRLKQRDSVLRTTSDASLLLEGILDLVVDRAFDIVDAFNENILKLEQEVLIHPKMRTLRRLHVLSGDLTLHRRTLDPLKTLIYGLRRYDTDRSVATTQTHTADGPVKVQGFLSHKTKVYLNDVHDHIELILASLEMFESISENLINFCFNAVSYETNEVMRRLTLVTIIFLPLTLISGYFGMNFEFMMVTGNSDIMFWIIALPIMAVLLPLFLWNDMVRAVHYLQKRLLARRVEREFS